MEASDQARNAVRQANTEPTEPGGAPSAAPGGLLHAALGLFAFPATGPLLALVVALVVFSVTTSTFFNAGNFSLVFQQSVVVGTLALGQTLVILVSDIDLANGAIMVLGTVVAGSYAVHGDPWTAMLLGLAVCVAASAFSGFIITRFRLPSFIATLGMFTILTAAARLYTQSRTYPVLNPVMTFLGTGPSIGAVTLTHGSMLWILLTLALGCALNCTAWGVRVYAIGDSRTAARMNGVHVERVILSVYTVAGVFYAFAALQALGRTPIADPSGYQTGNLDTITAVAIGGTSLFGGRGGVLGTFIGALIVVVLKNGLTQAGIDSLYQQIATGMLVILAVGVDQALGRGWRP